jgi:AraC-like DNA-binding protein
MKRGRPSPKVAQPPIATRVVVAFTFGHDRTLIADALRGRTNVVFVDTFRVLRARLAEFPTASAVILQARDLDGESAVVHVRHIARSYPRTAILVACRPTSEMSADIRALVVAGAHEFLFGGIDDNATGIRDALKRATQDSAADVVLRQLRPLFPKRLDDFLTCCVTQPGFAHTVNDVAEALGVHRKTLFNLCRGVIANLGPGELVSWCRVALAAYLLETPGRTVESVALEMDFPSVTALRNLIKGYTRMSATELRAAGGLEVAIKCVQERLTTKGGT